MEENSELEEEEAHYYKGDKDNIDPDTDLSYIDEKVQNILGHHRKDFEGGVSKEILGAKFGGYGSFLPTQERSPSNCSHATTPQSDSNKPLSECNLSMEGTSQNFQPVSNVSSFKRLGTVSCSNHSLQNSGVPSGDVPMKHDLRLSSARVAEKFNIKDESSSRSGNLTDPRTLRVRIKVSSNKMAPKNMAIYSGLGLDNSPSSSSGNSAEESGRTNPVSRATADESPTSILQVMTSFSVPGGVLVSPLHDSLFCLITKERLLRDREHVPTLKGSQEHSAMSVDKSVASMGNRKLLKEKKANLLGKISRPVEQKHGTDAKDENDTAFLKKKLENEPPGGKEINHNNVIRLSLSNPECVFGSVKRLARASEVSGGIDKDEVSDKLFSSNLEREDSFESISGHSGKSQKNGKSRSVVKVSEQVGTNSHHEVLGYLGDSGRYERKTHALSKARSGASKCNDDPIVLSKQKVGNKPSIQVQDEIKSCSEKEVPLVEGKKAKGNHSRGKAGIVSVKESLRDGVGVAPKSVATTGYGASTCQSKMQKLKSQKDTNRARVIHEDSLNTNLEQANNQLERTSSNKPGKKVDSQVMHELSMKDAPFMVPSTFEGGHAEMVPAVGDPVVINENWVCCDNCYKWRLLPFGTIPEHLPDNWLCSMLNWLPGMNHCDISEEETTKALYALYQLPITEGQNNLQSYANGPASVITLDHGQHLDQKHQSPDSAAVSVRAKKRAGDNGGIRISNATKNRLQYSVKSRSLNDKNHPPSESNEMKRSSSLHFIKSCNSDFDNSMAKQKKEQMNGGDSKKLKMKKKRDADQHSYGSSKKAKIEVTFTADRHRNSAVDHGTLVLKPNAGFQTEASGKNILNEPEDAQCDAKDRLLLSRKKLGGQTRVLSVGGPLDVRMQDKRNNSQSKKKWQDNQNGHDSKEYAKEESSGSGLGREKKSRVLKTEGRNFSGNKGADDKSNNRGASFFSTKSYVVDGMADVRSVDMGQKNRKNRRDFAAQRTSNAIELVRRHFGSGEVSVAATSSSSKVSSSCKNRADYEVVKGSPAESVSSSPFRISSYPDKLTSAAEDILRKGDGGTDCLFVNNNCERFLDGEGNGEINRSGTASKENDSSNFRPQPTKFSSFDFHDGNVNHKSTHKSKVPSEFGNGHFLNGEADSFERHQHISDMHVIEHSDDEGREKNSHENVLLPQKVDSGYFLPPKDSNRSYASASHRDKMKVSDSSSEHGDLHLKKSLKYESDIDVDHNAHYCEVICEVKNRFPERSRSKLHKNGKNHTGRRDHERQMPSDGRMEKQVIVREQHDSDVKLCNSTKRENASQWNLMQDLDGEVKNTQLERKTVNRKSMLLSSESKHEQSKKGCRSVPGSQKGGMFNEVLIDNSCKADVTNASKYPRNEGKKNELSLSLGHHPPDVIKDLNAPIDISMKSSSQNATIALKQAKELRDYADHLKGSGFDFESNEAYFQSALKFLHGASLLETCNGESGRNGEMTQIQAYSTTAKLCEFSGQEYERRQEMAAASLAYKCMEVAYMRVVYCKQSSTSRDLTELQATLHTTSQGESPSSSASDVDNLNNQMTADKSLTSKGKGSHVTGNHIVVSRNRSSFIRLLDFTQDVDFAMEASRKSRNAFAVASVTLEDAQNRESITIIKRVIDFSFQDVEGFLRLVRLGMEAINCSGFGVVRD